jgi:hypothetical protein
LPGPRPTRLPRDNHRPGSPTLLRPLVASLPGVARIVVPRREDSPLPRPGLGWARTRWYWNINQLCIDYAFRPRLSSRLTLGGIAFPRKPWAFGGGVSHPSLATHASILTRSRSTDVHTSASQRDRRSPTPQSRRTAGAASAVDLRPVTLSAQDHSTSELLRTLSRVAASKPTSWLSLRSHIVCHLIHTSGP